METESSLPHWQLVLQCLSDLGGAASYKEIEARFKEQYPERKASNVRPDLGLLTVNSNSRIHYSGGKQPRRTDTGNRYDRLFLTSARQYEIYDPVRHGVWEIALDSTGKPVVRQVSDGTAETEDSANEQETSDAEVNPAVSPEIGRRFALETQLRDYLAKNLSVLTGLPSGLVPYADASDVPGVEYRIDVGIIDILAKGTDGSFYILELKVGRGSDAALGQLMRYMGWVRTHLAGEARVYGVIVAAEISDKLRYGALVAQDVFLLEYELQVSVRAAKPVSPARR